MIRLPRKKQKLRWKIEELPEGRISESLILSRTERGTVIARVPYSEPSKSRSLAKPPRKRK